MMMSLDKYKGKEITAQKSAFSRQQTSPQKTPYSLRQRHSFLYLKVIAKPYIW
jgi:hypothetical protein